MGPTWNMLNTFKKYYLENILIESIMSADYMEYGKFKDTVKRLVNDRDFSNWKITCKLYKSMSMVNTDSLTQYRALGWLTFMHDTVTYAWQCRTVVKLLLNVHRLGNSLCSLCTKYCNNSIAHILFECEICDHVRCELWTHVLHMAPEPLAEDLMTMDIHERTKFILNSMNCDFVHEWRDLYVALCQYVYKIYTHYYNMSTAL